MKSTKSIKVYKGYASSFVFKINSLSSRFKKYTVRKFRKYNLGNSELIVISLLGLTSTTKDEITIKDLSAAHWMDKTYMSRACIRLISLGILKKTNSLKDKRSHFLSLEPKGIKIFKKLNAVKKIRYSKLVSNFSNNEFKQFNVLLDKLTASSDFYLIK